MAKLESEYQNKKLIPMIKKRLPGCMVLKNDPDYIQGIPDLTIFYGERWSMLEVKRSDKASHRPNQDHYISKFNDMGFARFISPETQDEVLSDMEAYLVAPKKEAERAEVQ